MNIEAKRKGRRDRFVALVGRANCNRGRDEACSEEGELFELVAEDPALCSPRYYFPGFTSLHPFQRLCSPVQGSRWDTSLALLQFIYESFPDVLDIALLCSTNPLFLACCAGAPLDVVRFLVRVAPTSLRVHTNAKDGRQLPLQAACAFSDLDVILYLTRLHPEALRWSCKRGALLIHFVCGNNGPKRQPQELLDILQLMVLVYPASTSVRADGVGTPLQHLGGEKDLNLSVLQFLASQSPKLEPIDMLDICERNPTMDPEIADFFDFATKRKRALPASLEELQLDLADVELALEDHQLMKEKKKPLSTSRRMLEGMRSVLPSIQEIDDEIETLDAISRDQLPQLQSLAVGVEEETRIAQWRLELLRAQQKCLQERLSKRIGLCRREGCTFFGQDDYGRLCSNCYMASPEGVALRSERITEQWFRYWENSKKEYTRQQEADAIIDERRRDYAYRMDQSPEEARAESDAAIQEEVKQLHRISMSRYTDPDSIWSALEEDLNSIVLLRASWLRQQSSFQKRPLPPRAMIDIVELKSIYQTMGKEPGQSNPLPIIAISHFWRTREHPDPEGETFRLVVETLNDYWSMFNTEDMGIFIDYCSLYQQPRSDAMQVAFEKSLETMSLWYGHALTTVWLVTETPDSILSYWDRGWTAFEYNLSTLIKPSNLSAYSRWPQLLDLGKARDRAKTVFNANAPSPQALVYRPPPADPLAFFQNHAYGSQTYTNGADRDHVVAPKFRRALVEILSDAKVLNFNGAHWRDEEIQALIRILPLCRNLERLQLAGNHIGNKGFRDLFQCIHLQRSSRQSLLCLKQVWVYNNPGGDIQDAVSGVEVYGDTCRS